MSIVIHCTNYDCCVTHLANLMIPVFSLLILSSDEVDYSNKLFSVRHTRKKNMCNVGWHKRAKGCAKQGVPGVCQVLIMMYNKYIFLWNSLLLTKYFFLKWYFKWKTKQKFLDLFMKSSVPMSFAPTHKQTFFISKCFELLV